MPASSRARFRTTRRGGGAESAAAAQGVEGGVLAAVFDPEHAAEVRATDQHEMDVVCQRGHRNRQNRDCADHPWAFADRRIVVGSKRLSLSFYEAFWFCAGSALTMIVFSLSVGFPRPTHEAPTIPEFSDHNRFKWKQETYVQVHENFLTNPSQEPGVCVHGSRIYLIGGYNSTRSDRVSRLHLADEHGTDRFTIYNMADSTVSEGPKLPFVGNHLGCAVSSDGRWIHVTGGFCTECSASSSHKRHWAIDINRLGQNLTNVKWERRADMPIAVGAHGCQFLRDEKMYCAGGGLGQWGPFSDQLSIYDVQSDSWTMGPPMTTGRDHIMHAASMYDNNVLFVVGGRASVPNYTATPVTPDPYFWTTAHTAEMFDLRLGRGGEWRPVRGPTTPREAVSLVPYNRRGSKSEPTILLVGSQRYLGLAGHATHTLDEFDPETGLYYCHRPLPYPLGGTAAGTYDGKLHVVGGGEWIQHSATSRLVIVDLEAVPDPENCFYQEYPVFDQWDRSESGLEPWTKMSSSSSQGACQKEARMFQSLLVATSEMNATTSQQKAKQCQEGEMAYLACYPDVMNAVGGGGFESGWDHYIQFGRKEGRIWQCP